MSFTSNMISTNDSIFNTELTNKGFAILDQMFKEYGWHMVKNEINWICYTKTGNETDLFDIKITQNLIKVSTPIKNSPFQFVTTFKDYFQASEYVEYKFYDFVGKKN